MTRPVPTLVCHFTDEANLPGIVTNGLLADTAVGDNLQREAGKPGIEARRRERAVPVGRYQGFVGDYVPFYFAPRSPMMYVISRGQVPEYGSDLASLVYLVSSVEQLFDLGHEPVFTRRNAVLANAEFIHDVGKLDDHVDWPLMNAHMWNDTDEDTDRKARRMAECLVHGRVDWAAFHEIGVFDDAARTRLARTLTTLNADTPVVVHRDWYY